MIKIISKDGKEKIWERRIQKNLSIINRKSKFTLPKCIKENILWVSDEYRKNPLSLEEGGSNIIVVFHEKKILGYKRIKAPSFYIKKILSEEISNIYIGFEYYSTIKKITILKQKISTIHALKYNENSYKEVWNSASSNELPWDSLKSFDLLQYQRTVARKIYNN